MADTLSSRRAFLAGAGGAAVARSLAGARKREAFALIGDKPHNSDYIRTGLRRTLAEGAGVTIDFCDEVERLSAATLSGYRLLILLRDGMTWPDGYPDETSNAGYLRAGSPALVSEPPVPATPAKPRFWMTPEQGRAVKDFVARGGGALLLHNVTHIGLVNAEFREVLGAAYEGHPPVRTFKVRVVNDRHPITRGVRDFVVTDEQHYMTYDRDPRHLLLESVNEQGLTWGNRGPRAPAGWAFDYGRGRVCYFAPGHLLTVLWNPEYVKLQQNAVRWLSRRI
jgi:hypothetical protein